MTKVFTLLSLAAVLAFASCAEKTVEVTNEDTTAVVVPMNTEVAPDTMVIAPDTNTVAPSEVK